MPSTLKERLQKKVQGFTKKVGEAIRNNDTETADGLRRKRYGAIVALAKMYDVYTLINPEGRTEFVDRGEWEHRMVAWARRTGVIPPGADLPGREGGAPAAPRRRRVTAQNHPENQPDAPPAAPPPAPAPEDPNTPPAGAPGQ